MLAVTAGCSDAEAPCGIGDTRACLGPGGCEGAQLCLEDQSGYGTCDCGGEDGDPVPGAGASAIDSLGIDAAVTAPIDSGADAATDAATDTGTEPATDAATDAGTDRGADADAAIDAGTDASTDAATDAGMDAATDAGTDADSPDPDDDAGAPFDICGTPVELSDYTARGSELIFDVATVAANATTNPFGADALSAFAGQVTVDRFPWLERPAACAGSGCYDGDAYLSLVYEGSDTALSMLLGISYEVGAGGTGVNGFAILSNEDVHSLLSRFNDELAGTPVLFAPTVMPNDRLDVQLEAMTLRAPVAAAWHTFTAWSPGGESTGYDLDDSAGRQMIEHGIALGVPIFMVRKGMPQGGFLAAYASPRDIGPVAAAYPAARFLVLQSAFEYGFEDGESSEDGLWPEGPYDPDDAEVQADYPLDRGVNSLITSLLDSGIGPNQNVYAVLDGVWAALITRPTEAAHVLGKLLRYVGEDNVLWGTDSVMPYGGPDPQIEAFRDFQIPPALRAQYGYPELTPERKAKIFGLNAARVFCIQPP